MTTLNILYEGIVNCLDFRSESLREHEFEKLVESTVIKIDKQGVPEFTLPFLAKKEEWIEGESAINKNLILPPFLIFWKFIDTLDSLYVITGYNTKKEYESRLKSLSLLNIRRAICVENSRLIKVKLFFLE